MASFTPTPEQARILAHSPQIHARVLAGPGTGKSATMVAWMSHLASLPSSPKVKLLTFTRAATAELAEKTGASPGLTAERPSTMHSFAITTLLRNPGSGGMPEPLRMADDWESAKVVTPSLARILQCTQQEVKALVQELAANWESLEDTPDDSISEQMRIRFLGAWNEHRTIFGYTLLAELPYRLRIALRDHPNLRGLGYDMVIVDEYQDLNACDLDVLRLLSERGVTIIAAGDDDQSIYSFRKAAPSGIRHFCEQYTRAADYTLSITQRCGTKIVEWANFLIQGDPDRSPTRPVLKSASGAPTGDVGLYSFANNAAEARGVVTLIQHLISDQHVPANEILVLHRADFNGNFSTPIKELLTTANIPHSDPDSVIRMLQGGAARAQLELLRLLADREDSIAWCGLLTLAQGIGSTFIDYVYNHARSQRISFSSALSDLKSSGFPGGPRSSKAAASLIEQTNQWLNMHEVPSVTPEDGWGKWILDVLPTNNRPAPDADFATLLLAIDDLVEPELDLQRYIGQIGPLGKDWALANSSGVRFMSMGGSKGLTVRAAIIPALEEQIIPHPNGDVGEERRLLYVAMTRAKGFVYGTWARRRTGPTARSGSAQVGNNRTLTHFLEGGPVESKSL